MLPSWKLSTSSASGYEQLASTYDYALKKFGQTDHPSGISCLRGFDLAEAIKGLNDKLISHEKVIVNLTITFY